MKALYVASDNTLRAVHNYYPRNSFRLFLNFERPSVLDFRLLPSLDTPNGSNFEIEGYDATWVNGVFSEITKFFKEKPAKLPIIHRHSIYDVLLYPLGMPFAFWVCQKANPAVEAISPGSSFFQNALFVYLFAASLILFRVLFHYLRWVAPIAEYRSASSKVGAHRALLAALSFGIFGSFLYDVLKFVFGFGASAG